MMLNLVPKMTARSIIATASAVLVLSTVWTPAAFAANCGNGQNGQALLMGCDNNTSTDTTVYTQTHDAYSGLWVKATGAGSWGILAEGTARAVSGLGGTIGVYGSGTTTGVYGSGSTYGVSGNSDSQIGVFGSGGSTGIYGSGVNYGVLGSGSTGVYGSGDVGVHAVSNALGNTGLGLLVTGRSVFRTAGTAVVASGQKKVTVSLTGVSSTDFVLATVQDSGGFFVKSAKAGSGQFTITINKAPTSPAAVTVGYFVISAS
jgi:hypothetical protein